VSLGVCCGLDELGDVIFTRDDEGEGVIAIAGIEADSLLEVADSCREILVFDLLGAFEVGVVRFAGLFGRDGVGDCLGLVLWLRRRCGERSSGDAGRAVGGVGGLCEGRRAR